MELANQNHDLPELSQISVYIRRRNTALNYNPRHEENEWGPQRRSFILHVTVFYDLISRYK